MNRSVFSRILYLIALPAGLLIGLQVGSVHKQYERARENFAGDVRTAIAEVQQIYARWNSHTSSEEDAASYNSLYTNADSTFSVLIAQTVQPYPLLDFAPDTLLPEIRKVQFDRFREELERTRRRENPRLREFYVLRSIQYCNGCETGRTSVAEVFPLDSLVRARLAARGIDTPVELGFYNTQLGHYGYRSAAADTAALAASPYQFSITPTETLQLHFPRQNREVWRTLIGTLIASLGLILIAVLCFGLAGRMLLRQKKLTEMKNDFINNVTHEFKTPIATIAFALANIENEAVLRDPAAIRQFTQVIKAENKRLNGQVEKVLQAATLDRKTLELEREAVDVHQLIDALVNAYALQLGPDDTLRSELAARHATLTGDPVHLSNAISNLLDNAIKYSTPPRTITIRTQDAEAGLQIAVADNGPGIAPEAQSLIFEKFYRIPTGNLHAVKGFGLGLSYVRAIAVAHGGSVRLNSRPGRGSTFTIELPLSV